MLLSDFNCERTAKIFKCHFVVIVYISCIIVNAYFSLFTMLCKQITINDDWVDECLKMVLNKITKLRFLKIALYVKE